MQNSKEHIRHCLLYEYQLGHSAIEAGKNICQAIGEGVISTATAYRWYERFRNGDYSLEDEPRPGQPTKISLKELEEEINSDPSLTTREVASKLGCCHATIYYRFKDLRLVPKLGGWLPHDLNQSQLKKRVEACQELLEMRRNFNWLDNLITGDEKWVVYANIRRKRQWLPPRQKAKPTPKAGLHPEKRMISVWWNVTGVVYWELLPEKTTITATRYCAQIQRMAAELNKKNPQHGQMYFQHDNARPHVANLVKAKLERLGWKLLPHPPYSPDLAPSDYHLFLSLSNDLAGKKFKNETELKQYLQSFFDSKPATFYASGIRDLPRRWQEVVDSQGKYISKK